MRKGNLAEFFAASPLVGSDLKIEREKGGAREIEFETLLDETGDAAQLLGMDSGRDPPGPKRPKRGR